MGLKSLIKKYKKMKANPFSGNVKDRLDKAKDFMSEAQQGDVASKYAGIRTVPGVKSEMERDEDSKAAAKFTEQQIAATAAATAETERLETRTRSSMPSKAEQDLIAKRRLAASKRRGGRASTILSDETLG